MPVKGEAATAQRRCGRHLRPMWSKNHCSVHAETAASRILPVLFHEEDATANGYLRGLTMMHRSLREHITQLEQRIESLEAALADPDRTTTEKVDLRLDLEIAERALTYFRKAFELEQRILH